MKLPPDKKLPLSLGARCDLCPLGKKGIPVHPETSLDPRFVLVGEGPGVYEERLGKPFQGRSGKFLDQLLAANKLIRKNAHVTNAALCRGEDDDEKELARACCATRLLSELRQISPTIPIVPMGGQALQTVLSINSILLARGFVWTAPELDEKSVKAEYKKIGKHEANSRDRKFAELAAETMFHRAQLKGRTVLPTLHPAFVLRSETWSPWLKIDFDRIGRVVKGEKISLADRGELVVTGSVVKLRRLLAKSLDVSLDVETTIAASPLLVRLLCVGLANREGLAVVLWPWNKRKMARDLAKFLRSRSAVIGHNLMGFDRVVLEKEGVR